jgi:hypothetical protein
MMEKRQLFHTNIPTGGRGVEKLPRGKPCAPLGFRPEHAHVDGGLDQVGREDGERDRFVDLARAVSLTLCDACCRDVWIRDDPIEPDSTARSVSLGHLGRGELYHELIGLDLDSDHTRSDDRDIVIRSIEIEMLPDGFDHPHLDLDGRCPRDRSGIRWAPIEQGR